MSSKYTVEVTYDLATTIEPDYIRIDEPNDVEDWEDNSYFDSTEVESSGGSVTFTVEAEDEDEAEDKAREAVYDGMEVEDNSGLTWGVTNVSIDVEKVEVPMTWERAVEILNAMADDVTDEQREAIEFVLHHVTELNTTLRMARERQVQQQQQITALEQRIAALEAATPAPHTAQA